MTGASGLYFSVQPDQPEPEMISVILYGRNDSHGYNLPKRAAISLNCIAEVLSDADDEILFIDYNTPDDLPTFIEAIYDTLTSDGEIAAARVSRPAATSRSAMVEQTHLAALEPHSRNIAIRRSNPRNRWLLFTNTDMIFLPRGEISDLTGAVADLPDGLYIVPRFELPEPLWESFPRSDPAAILRTCRHLGPALHVDEITLALPANRFDQPGDFQLAPRQAMWAIHGFEERMIHGWHHDSNVCKRLHLYLRQPHRKPRSPPQGLPLRSRPRRMPMHIGWAWKWRTTFSNSSSA